MEMKDFSKDRDLLKGATRSDGVRVIATKAIDLIVPQRFVDRDLVILGTPTLVLGILMVVVGKKYAVLNTCCMFKTKPGEVTRDTLDDVGVYVLKYQPGDVLVDNINVVMDDKLLYLIYDELYNSKLPPYLLHDPNDAHRVFDTAEYFTGVSLYGPLTISHFVGSLTLRSGVDLNKYYREMNDAKNRDNVVFVGMGSVTHGATDNVSRFMGGYFEDKLTTSLTTDVKEVTPIEHILRS